MIDQLHVPNVVTSVKLPVIPIEWGGSCSRFGRSELCCNVSGHVGITVGDGWTTEAG